MNIRGERTITLDILIKGEVIQITLDIDRAKHLREVLSTLLEPEKSQPSPRGNGSGFLVPSSTSGGR
jgi:hypothetical protein